MTRIGAVAVLFLALAAFGAMASTGRAGSRTCASGLGATRDPSNPLALATPPGSNPLNGAEGRFFVQTPARGTAAQAIAALLGVTPPDTESWAAFEASLTSGPLAAKLAGNPALATQVALLSKIADEPETSRFSSYTAGGGAGAVYSQLSKFLCRMHTVAPDAIPLLSTYFIQHTGGCPTMSPAAQATFRRRVREFVAAVGNYPSVIFVEEDAVDTAGCLTRLGLAVRERLLTTRSAPSPRSPTPSPTSTAGRATPLPPGSRPGS